MSILGVLHVVSGILLYLKLEDSMAFRAVFRYNALKCNLNIGHSVDIYIDRRFIATHSQPTAMGNDMAFSIGMDPFCYKQFDKQQENHIPLSKDVFIQELRWRMQKGEAILREGYAPFCKHLFVENFTDATSGSLPITPENQHLLRSGYVARTEKELPVLSRWFQKDDVAHALTKAKYLDVILYSREQVIKEHEAMKEKQVGALYDFDFYVISIKPQNTDQETPMMPITMFRNTILSEGGSGMPIDRGQYLKSVEFWQNNAIIR